MNFLHLNLFSLWLMILTSITSSLFLINEQKLPHWCPVDITLPHPQTRPATASTHSNFKTTFPCDDRTHQIPAPKNLWQSILMRTKSVSTNEGNGYPRSVSWTQVCDGHHDCTSKRDEEDCVGVTVQKTANTNVSTPKADHTQESPALIYLPELNHCQLAFCYDDIDHKLTNMNMGHLISPIDATKSLAHSICQQSRASTFYKIYPVQVNHATHNTTDTQVFLNGAHFLEHCHVSHTVHSCLRDLLTGAKSTNTSVSLLPVPQSPGLLKTSCQSALGVVCLKECKYTIFFTGTVTNNEWGYIESPGYPHQLLNNLECKWILITRRGWAFTLRFETLNFSPDRRAGNSSAEASSKDSDELCHWLYLDIGLGPSKSDSGEVVYGRKRLCGDEMRRTGDSKPLEIKSDYHRVVVRFAAFFHHVHLNHPAGFRLAYSTHLYTPHWLLNAGVQPSDNSSLSSGNVTKIAPHEHFVLSTDYIVALSCFAAIVGMAFCLCVGLFCIRRRRMHAADRASQLRAVNANRSKTGVTKDGQPEFNPIHTPPDVRFNIREEIAQIFTQLQYETDVMPVTIDCPFCNNLKVEGLDTACSHVTDLLFTIADPSYSGPPINLHTIRQMMFVITPVEKRFPDPSLVPAPTPCNASNAAAPRSPCQPVPGSKVRKIQIDIAPLSTNNLLRPHNESTRLEKQGSASNMSRNSSSATYVSLSGFMCSNSTKGDNSFRCRMKNKVPHNDVDDDNNNNNKKSISYNYESDDVSCPSGCNHDVVSIHQEHQSFIDSSDIFSDGAATLSSTKSFLSDNITLDALGGSDDYSVEFSGPLPEQDASAPPSLAVDDSSFGAWLAHQASTVAHQPQGGSEEASLQGSPIMNLKPPIKKTAAQKVPKKKNRFDAKNKSPTNRLGLSPYDLNESKTGGGSAVPRIVIQPSSVRVPAGESRSAEITTSTSDVGGNGISDVSAAGSAIVHTDTTPKGRRSNAVRVMRPHLFSNGRNKEQLRQKRHHKRKHENDRSNKDQLHSSAPTRAQYSSISSAEQDFPSQATNHHALPGAPPHFARIIDEEKNHGPIMPLANVASPQHTAHAMIHQVPARPPPSHAYQLSPEAAGNARQHGRHRQRIRAAPAASRYPQSSESDPADLSIAQSSPGRHPADDYSPRRAPQANGGGDVRNKERGRLRSESVTSTAYQVSSHSDSPGSGIFAQLL